MLPNDLLANSRNHGEACCSHSLRREQSTAHCEVVRFQLVRAEELRKKERSHCWKGPSGKQSKSECEHCCCKAQFAAGANFWRGMRRWPSHWALELLHGFSYLCRKPQGNTAHKVRSPCHTNFIVKSKCRSSKSEARIFDRKVNKEDFESSLFISYSMLYLLIRNKISHS